MKIVAMANNDHVEKLEPRLLRMATVIAEIIEDKGGCLPHDLEARGFTRDEINQRWSKAKEASAALIMDAPGKESMKRAAK